MNILIIRRAFLVCFSIAVFALAIAAQDGVQTRSITSDDFVSRRPASSTTATVTKRRPVKRKPVRYRFVRAHRSQKAKQPTANSEIKTTEIGVTVWRMRPPARNEKNVFLLPVLDDNKERKMWLAERVPVDTLFDAGDRIRFAVESSDSGYLYIFGRETYADGSLGAPYPVFAASRTGENLVRPGMLFDIPDQREDLPYLRMNPTKEGYSGEVLTIIVSPKPLSDFELGDDGKLKSGEDLTELEFNSVVDIFTRTDAADKIYSKEESESACGLKTRELQREKSKDPCGLGTRQLSREEALPQSIYRIKTLAGRPAVATVKLSVRN